MSGPDQKFEAALDSDSRRTPVRVAFLTRRTSPHVKAADDAVLMTWPEALFRIIVAAEALTVALALISLLWDAPLEELADPLQTPNPAKAPWYFLGLQELLHYFPPVVGGVLIPTLVVIALIVIPYFNVNVQAEGLWLQNKQGRLRTLAIVTGALTLFLAVLKVWAILIPTLAIAALMAWSAGAAPDAPSRLRRWLFAKPLSFWIMNWFLIVSALLTVIGTFFRGAGWEWVWPWEG
jgi:cytochrome b/b6/petD-like protein